MRVAFYGRYSTDKQDADSLARQIRNCELRAEREGWSIVERYEDPAVSGGTRMRERPEGARSLADAEAKRFDIILVDDLGRAFRNQADQIDTLEWLLFHGVNVVGASDGIDTRMENYNLSASMHGIMNAQYRKDLAKKVHGQLSLIAANGKNAGGLPYGYKVVYETVTDEKGRATSRPVDRVKDEAKAKWVRFIFEKYADGWSPRKIADELNRLEVPSPGSTWKRSKRRCRGWLGSAIMAMLDNPLYIGKQVWNRSKWVDIPLEVRRKKGLRGKKQRVERPESEWIVTEAPKLRIIKQPLWDAVSARLAEVRKNSEAIRAALHRNARTGAGPKYLLSGLLKCGVCGSNFVTISQYQYGCATYTNGGKHACGNKLRVSRTVAENRLLEGIQTRLFTPEALDLFKREAVRLLTEHRHTTAPDRERAKTALAQAEREVANLVTAIKAGILTPTTKAELEKAEAECARLRATLETDAKELEKVAAVLPRAIDRYNAMLVELADPTPRDVPQARSQVRDLLGGEVRLQPTEHGYLEAEFAGDYAGLLKLAGRKINLVAGGRLLKANHTIKYRVRIPRRVA